MNKKPARLKRSGRHRVLAAAAVLAATLGIVRFFDFAGESGPIPALAAPSEPYSMPLALPLLPQPVMGETAGDATASRTTEPLPSPIDVAIPTPPVDAVVTIDEDAPSLLTEADPEQEAETAAEPLTATAEETPVAAEETTINAEPHWIEHRVTKGESLARIFSQHGLDAKLLHNIVTSSKQAETLAQIRPGQKLRFQFDENRELTKLELQRNRVESIRVSIADDEIALEEISKDVDTRVGSTAGLIESSLFVDGQRAGLSDGQIMELANIFGWDIDFALEIRAGDEFRVLYEEHYLEGEKLRNGPILAAEFTNRGTTYRAVRYEDGNGEVGYYDVDGQSKRRAFIRTPIKFARVSSGFNPKRWHPILKKWRSHKGVDYAAPTGTPVKATGDGRVVFRGSKNGYGKTVIIEHAGKYTTLYAHLSGYSKRAETGKRVKQGQVIGYVGKTGLASGPHLHYEFRVQGQHRDPLRVKLPKSLGLPKQEIAQFRKATAPLLAQLEAIPSETMVASAGSSQNNP